HVVIARSDSDEAIQLRARLSFGTLLDCFAVLAMTRHGPAEIVSQNKTMILPNTCRLSSRARPRSNSASGTSVSITGKRPAAILSRLSRILRIEAPNDPKMRNCGRQG